MPPKALVSLLVRFYDVVFAPVTPHFLNIIVYALSFMMVRLIPFLCSYNHVSCIVLLVFIGENVYQYFVFNFLLQWPLLLLFVALLLLLLPACLLISVWPRLA